MFPPILLIIIFFHIISFVSFPIDIHQLFLLNYCSLQGKLTRIFPIFFSILLFYIKKYHNSHYHTANISLSWVYVVDQNEILTESSCLCDTTFSVSNNNRISSSVCSYHQTSWLQWHFSFKTLLRVKIEFSVFFLSSCIHYKPKTRVTSFETCTMARTEFIINFVV